MSFQGLVGSTGWASLVLHCDQCWTCCLHPKPNFAETCPNHPNSQRKTGENKQPRLFVPLLRLPSDGQHPWHNVFRCAISIHLQLRDCGHLSARPRQPALLSNWGLPVLMTSEVWKLEIPQSILKHVVMLHASWSPAPGSCSCDKPCLCSCLSKARTWWPNSWRS